MVSEACSNSFSQVPTMMVQEKGSRNKRKFRADPPLADPNKTIPVPHNECNDFEFSAERFEVIPSRGYDTCDASKLDLGLSCATGTSEVGPSWHREEIESSSDEIHDADWSDLTESELEELVLSNLDTIFKSAIKKIIASGYSEEVATKAILRSGLCYGCKDIVSNIVDNTLAFLRSGQDVNLSKEHYFEDLQQMGKYILAELVCLLTEVRPFFSTGDAMWCLLICDMNVSHACAIDVDPPVGDATSNQNSSAIVQPPLRYEPKDSEQNISLSYKPDPSFAYAQNCPSEQPIVASVHDRHSFQSEAPILENFPNLKPKTSFVLSELVQEKECQNSISNASNKPFSEAGISRTTIAEEKFVGSRKVSGITKREYILRQKSIFFEKHYGTNGSKVTSRAGKLSGFGGLVLDKKLKPIADPTGINVKNTSAKINKAVGFDVPQDNVNHNLSTSTGFTSLPKFGLETGAGSSSLPKSNIPPSLPLVPINTSPSLPVADTELSLSLPAKCISNPMLISSNSDALNFNADLSNEKSLGQWAPHDGKDDMIMTLVSRVRELQNQLQEWTEWANQRVMQAARRLSKDKVELKTLRQEKEEVERLKKEKQTLEENTMKKLSEMENALFKASGQVERASAAVRRLGVENTALRQEMEAAKLHASESAASCQEVSEREKQTLMKFQSREKQKSMFQEELAAEKRKLVQLQKELQQAKDVQDEVEGRLKQEEKAKEEILMRASLFRKEREQIENLAKSKEDMMKMKAENNLQKCKDDIEKLQKEISKLRLISDSSKIAALRRGIPMDSPISYIMETDFLGLTGNEGVKRERECVMCLSEEMSVVFLPCAHQVVCTLCNELHEKQGMKECPSCRSPIQQRICVRYAQS
ncbi:putative E3 ubiquitin-protein ligase [Forsythia ovata]|uniref:E3 ubiquitin-protein ligase n=1 Tax=Forsythia ovata TaxID=205694 RepID=A0ABD1P7V5_9LAMI